MKLTGLWRKDTNDGYKFAPGKPVEIGGVKYWLDMFPVQSDNPNSPEFQVYLKPCEQPEAELSF